MHMMRMEGREGEGGAVWGSEGGGRVWNDHTYDQENLNEVHDGR